MSDYNCPDGHKTIRECFEINKDDLFQIIGVTATSLEQLALFARRVQNRPDLPGRDNMIADLRANAIATCERLIALLKGNVDLALAIHEAENQRLDGMEANA